MNQGKKEVLEEVLLSKLSLKTKKESVKRVGSKQSFGEKGCGCGRGHGNAWIQGRGRGKQNPLNKFQSLQCG